MRKIDYINPMLKEKIDDNHIKYAGYSFYSDGRILNKHQKSISVSSTTGNIRLIIEGKARVLKGGRFIYELFNNTILSGSDLVIYKDNDNTNIALENLEVITRKDYFKDKECNYKFDKETQEIIKKKYEEGKVNGVTMYSLADEYDCCHITIWKIINGTYQREK